MTSTQTIITTKDKQARIVPVKKLIGKLKVPGDKSICHRALIFSALAQGESRISNFSNNRDNGSTMEILTHLGAKFSRLEDSEHLVCQGVGEKGLTAPLDKRTVLNVGNSGTTMRLLCGLLASQPFSVTLDGDASIRRRPMARVVEPLLKMGAHIQGSNSAEKAGEIYPPLHLDGRSLTGIDYQSPIPSAQLKSALLLAGMYSQGETSITEDYKSRDHTEKMMQYLGLPLEIDGLTVRNRAFNPPFAARDFLVPGDISSAAFFIMAAVLVEGARVEICDISLNPTRTGFLEAMQEMGAGITIVNQRTVGGEEIGDIVVQYQGNLKGISIQAPRIPRLIDELPLLAVGAAFARGKTEIRGAAELRVKESDRISAMAQELSKMGAKVKELPDGMVIDGQGFLEGGSQIESHGDHRIAMAMAVAALNSKKGGILTDTDPIAVSFPGFFEQLNQMNFQVG